MKIGDQVFRAVLDTGATLSLVACRLLKTFKKTKTVAIRVGDGRTIHSLGGIDVTICLGEETVTQYCRVLDTDAFDIVIGTDFLRRNPQVKMLSLQRPYSLHCPQAVRQSIAGAALPTAPRQCGSGLQEWHCPLPPGSEAVHCRSCTAHCSQAVRQCIAGVALPTPPGQWGGVLREFHCPLPPGSEAAHCRSSTVHFPQAVGQSIAGLPLPTAPRQ